jgi:hypothetical protein
MDNLEKYIKENRNDLDKYSPSPSVWQGIRSGMKNSKRSLLIRFSAAAMITVILGTAAFFYVWYNRTSSMTYKGVKNNTYFMPDPQLKETEIYYNNLINELYTKATSLTNLHPDIDKELFNDLTQLDSIYAEIKKDLKDNIANQEVIEALINNYRIRIRMLEEILDILKQNENGHEKNNNHVL